uniref:Reverse transcriptase domain-containing protein n=1 Tax=Nicotiana tabacum TaxID=4097 RepID=A0A1S3YYH3_TOBAC|nr:PREDICTED: uncharacterized protein LOC107781232 [Nicotiana tabacum]
MGDYNAVIHVDDRLNGAEIQEQETRDFIDFLFETGLTELKTVGRKYTWTNNHIYSKIDRAVVKGDWMIRLPHLEVIVLDHGFSNHSPLSTTFDNHPGRRARPFKFLNHLTEHQEFLDKVAKGWREPVSGVFLKSIWQKLKNVKTEMKLLNKEEYNAADMRISTIRSNLQEAQEQMRLPGHDPALFDKEKSLKIDLEKWVKIDEMIARQKSRMKWLKLGDSNEDDIKEEVLKFFKQLLCKAAPQLLAVKLSVFSNGPKLNRSQQLQLINPITREEVYVAVKDINDMKAPGVDGFNIYFFKKAWPVIGNERMQKVMDTLVDRSQSAFVPGRLISDNIILSHELVKGYGRKGISPRCMLKVDMQKAYDSVEWIFIEQVLVGLNFPTQFIQWIMQCLKTVSYSILINGHPTEPLNSKKGLRQGDPISPFLFVLVMEYFSRVLKSLGNEADFNYHPKCEKMNGGVKSIQMLFDCFHEFSTTSGLSANRDKSSIYFGGVDATVQQQIIKLTGFTKGELPIRYLGVPLSTKRLSELQCQLLLEKMMGRIQSWTAKFLSYAGRVQLIKNVLFSVQVFWSQIFVLPAKVVELIEITCRKFLWTGGVELSKMAFLAWDRVCYPQVAGGPSLARDKQNGNGLAKGTKVG